MLAVFILTSLKPIEVVEKVSALMDLWSRHIKRRERSPQNQNTGEGNSSLNPSLVTAPNCVSNTGTVDMNPKYDLK